VKRVFVSDCEGPISKNDNAFEATSHFVPNGDKLFAVISKYDDVLADVLKRPDYRAGETLKLVLPFLKAYGATDQKMRQFAARNLLLIPDARDALQHIRSIAPTFIVSTSYEHYVSILCRVLGFPFENTYCTHVNIDKYKMAGKEKSLLRQIARETARMPIVSIPRDAKTIEDFAERDRMAILRLDELFWGKILGMGLGKMYSKVRIMGGAEKAEAIKDVVHKLGVRLSGVMYVGDSITDEEAFTLLRENEGLGVSFNGNQYAVKNAEVAVLSENSTVTAVIADLFIRLGKRRTLDVVSAWSHETLRKSSVDQKMLECLFKLYPSELPKVEIITDKNKDVLAKQSEEFRRRVRGEAVGRLG
jgi:energy-converting hydrogenase A subunit R